MKKHTSKNAPMFHAAMLTTLLVVPFVVQATTSISSQVTIPQDSSTNAPGPITITPDGQVLLEYFSCPVADLVTMTNTTPLDNTLTIEPNNTNGIQAIYNRNVTSCSNSIVNFSETGTLAIGVGSGISSYDDFPGDHTVYVSNGAATVNNAGTIKSLNGDNDLLNIFVDVNSSLILNNQDTGLIQGSLPVYIAAGSFGSSVTNGGTIQNNTNVGATSGSAIYIAGSLTSFSNTGIIETTSTHPGPTIVVAGTTIAGGLNNAGDISCTAAQTAAIDLSGSTDVALNQLNGTITGNVLLAPGDNVTSFNMTGGQIVGDVMATTGIQGNTLKLYGGTITGTVTIQNATSGGDSFNLYGGSFDLLVGNTNTTFNVFTSFVANGNISKIGNIIVNEGGIFTATQPVNDIDGLDGLQINSGGTLIANSTITGATSKVGNAGTLILNDAITFNNAIFDNTGNVQIGALTSATADNFNGMPGSTITPILYPNSFPTATNAAIIVENSSPGAGTLASGSMIAPQLLAGVYYDKNSTFYIMNANGGGTVDDNSTLVQPSSVLVHFAKSQPVNNELVLTFLQNSFQRVLPIGVTNDGLSSIAATLDGLDSGSGPSDPALRAMLVGLESATSVSLLEAEVESLLPADNWGMPQAVTFVMNSNFSTIHSQMKKVQALYSMQADNMGLSSGDNCEDGGLWGKMLGAYLDQSTRQGISGYHAKAVGFVIGGEREVADCAAIGLAAGYTKVNVEGKGFAPKNQAIKDIQGTLYGWYNPTEQIFIDGMVGLAGQQYDTNRIINAQTLTSIAEGSFKGWQLGAQGNVGYAFINDANFFAAPFACLRYNYLNLNSYTETGAGSLGLAVAGETFNEFAGGVGIQLAMQRKNCGQFSHVPELDVLVLYDFTVDAQNTTSNFLGGGATFGTNGVKPGRTIVDLDFVWNVQVAPESIFTLEYDVEFRSQFVGNAGYIQFFYYW